MSENFIRYLELLPKKLTAIDLVNLGLYKTKKAVFASRYRNISPPFFKENNTYYYDRDQLITFIKEHYYSCSGGTRIYSISPENLLKLKNMPLFVTIKQMVDLGVYKSNMQAHSCRIACTGSSYICISKTILYLRDEVIKLCNK